MAVRDQLERESLSLLVKFRLIQTVLMEATIISRMTALSPEKKLKYKFKPAGIFDRRSGVSCAAAMTHVMSPSTYHDFTFIMTLTQARLLALVVRTRMVGCHFPPASFAGLDEGSAVSSTSVEGSWRGAT